MPEFEDRARSGAPPEEVWKPPAAPGDGYPAAGDPLLNAGKPGLERLEPCDLAVPLGGVRVAGQPAAPLPGGDGGTGPGLPHPGGEGGAPGREVPARELPGVLARSGDRPGPPGRRLRGQGPLPFPAGFRLALGAEPALRAPGGQVPSGEGPQVTADRPQHGLVLLGDAQPGPDPRPSRGGGDERLRDLPQRPAHPDAPARAATSITVHVEIPEAEAHRLAAQQDVISQSLSRLAALAAAESR